MHARTKRAATALLTLLALTTILSAQVNPIYQVIVGLDAVELDVAVSDRGRAVMQLAKEDFVVLEDGQPQEIRDFAPSGMPYSILVLVDRSERDGKTKWPRFILDSVDLFMRNLRGPDRLAVAGFDDRVAVLLDWRPSKNGNPTKVMLRKSKQETRFFEAIDWASEEMQFVANTPLPGQATRVQGRRGVLVFTDGRDRPMYPQTVEINGRPVPDPDYAVPASVDQRFKRTLNTLAQSKVPFYIVAIDTDKQIGENSAKKQFPGYMRFLTEVRTRMEQLATASGGGIAFPQQMEDLIPLYTRVHRDLGSAYHLSYLPLRAADGKVRKIEVKLRNTDLQIYQSRDNYLPR